VKTKIKRLYIEKLENQWKAREEDRKEQSEESSLSGEWESVA